MNTIIRQVTYGQAPPRRPDDAPLIKPLALADGRVVQFRLLTPADKPVIQAAVALLSPETSRRRFFTVRHALSDRELDDLTNLDGWNRFAIGAYIAAPDGATTGVGVARFVRVAESPEAAEFALIVVDAFQGQGVGKRLLHELVRAARERGIACLRGQVLADNEPMLALLRNHARGRLRVTGSDPLDVSITLDEPRGAARIIGEH
ncbi:MAG TPA: GNAT family N-acetyltransferase [Casimicrobiaceae bacterium]|nr:GNAT family N-acetyltransferase [Casimicrobiaceae bacterium]